MRKRDITKQQILETALALFTEKGIQKNSVDEIVKKSGVAKGTFFYHFSQNDQLIYEIINMAFEGYFKIPEQLAADKQLKAPEKMEQVLINLFSAYKAPMNLEQIFQLGLPIYNLSSL